MARTARAVSPKQFCSDAVIRHHRGGRSARRRRARIFALYEVYLSIIGIHVYIYISMSLCICVSMFMGRYVNMYVPILGITHVVV